MCSQSEKNSYAIYYALDDFDKIGSGDFFTLIRYTAKDGYNYVWNIRTQVLNEALGAISGSSQCMTNDCLVLNTGAKLDALKFNNGPNIEWIDHPNNQMPQYELKQN